MFNNTKKLMSTHACPNIKNRTTGAQGAVVTCSPASANVRFLCHTQNVALPLDDVPPAYRASRSIPTSRFLLLGSFNFMFSKQISKSSTVECVML